MVVDDLVEGGSERRRRRGVDGRVVARRGRRAARREGRNAEHRPRALDSFHDLDAQDAGARFGRLGPSLEVGVGGVLAHPRLRPRGDHAGPHLDLVDPGRDGPALLVPAVPGLDGGRAPLRGEARGGQHGDQAVSLRLANDRVKEAGAEAEQPVRPLAVGRDLDRVGLLGERVEVDRETREDPDRFARRNEPGARHRGEPEAGPAGAGPRPERRDGSAGERRRRRRRGREGEAEGERQSAPAGENGDRSRHLHRAPPMGPYRF